MEILKLNCPSCGAPIIVPEDLDFINCASCWSALTIRRGEGYVALKMAEKVAQTIRQTGQETQSAIREGTEVTRKEFQRLQYGQELSMAEMRLTTLRGEIRNAQRETKTPVVETQIRELHLQECDLMGKIRTLKAQLAALDCADPFERIAFVEEQSRLLDGEINLIKSISPQGEDTRLILDELNALSAQLADQALAVRVKNLKSGLKSFRPEANADQSLAGLTATIEINRTELDALYKLPASKEVEQVKTDLQACYSKNYAAWDKLENHRIVGLLESTRNRPTVDNQAAMQESYTRVQNDLRKLAAMPTNPVIVSYQKQLGINAKNLARQIEIAQKKAARAARTAAGQATIGDQISNLFDSIFN